MLPSCRASFMLQNEQLPAAGANTRAGLSLELPLPLNLPPVYSSGEWVANTKGRKEKGGNGEIDGVRCVLVVSR